MCMKSGELLTLFIMRPTQGMSIIIEADKVKNTLKKDKTQGQINVLLCYLPLCLECRYKIHVNGVKATMVR